MEKRKLYLILSIAIIVTVISVLCAVPVENWSITPYFLIPIGVGALIATVGLIYRLVKNIPLKDDDSEEQLSSPELDDLKKLDGGDEL